MAYSLEGYQQKDTGIRETIVREGAILAKNLGFPIFQES